MLKTVQMTPQEMFCNELYLVCGERGQEYRALGRDLSTYTEAACRIIEKYRNLIDTVERKYASNLQIYRDTIDEMDAEYKTFRENVSDAMKVLRDEITETSTKNYQHKNFPIVGVSRGEAYVRFSDYIISHRKEYDLLEDGLDKAGFSEVQIGTIEMTIKDYGLKLVMDDK